MYLESVEFDVELTLTFASDNYHYQFSYKQFVTYYNPIRIHHILQGQIRTDLEMLIALNVTELKVRLLSSMLYGDTYLKCIEL